MTATIVRRFAQILSRGRTVVRRLPPRFGGIPITAAPSASLRLWGRDLERSFPELFRWADELVERSSVVWDVGANCGLFSFAAACRAGASGRVVAFEPDPWLASLIRQSAARLPADWAPIEVQEVALSDRRGDRHFAVNTMSRARSHLVPGDKDELAGSAADIATVRVSTLDDFWSHLSAPDLVKIDVEGEEARVLLGATNLLRQVRPRIIVEVREPEVIGSLLRGQQYVLFDADRRQSEQAEIAAPAWNTLALPRCSGGEEE